MSNTQLAAALAVAVLALGACASTPRASTVSKPAPVNLDAGTVAVTATVRDRDCKDDQHCAQSEAIRAILFIGVPGSRVPRAMIADERAALEKHKAYFTQLFDRREYTRYVVSVKPSTSGAPKGSKSYQVTVNIDALRITLEREGIVRRFGY